MNQIGLLAKFENIPSEKDQHIIEKEMRYFLLSVQPSATLEVASGNGSWWILVWTVVEGVAGWAISEFASWSVNKGLDKLADKINKNGQLSTSQEPELPSLSGNSIVEPSTSVTNQAEKQRMLDHLLHLKEITEKLNTKELIFSEWSENEQLGRSIIFQNTEEGVRCQMHQTDSKEDFNSYINPE